MREKFTIKFESDCDGFFARATVRGTAFFAFGTTPETAEATLLRKVQHYLHPQRAPQPKEVEV